ncbi:MAG: N-acetylneuraminate synthase [Kiritimatiellae bacterium]|nr:N-acetylneuraminate synthase [Kiritimatiellia bacterium]
MAEAGVNHNGRLERAIELADAAQSAGADAVKFQTFRADRLVSSDAPKAVYQCERTHAEESQRDMLRRLELSEEDHRVLAAHCAKRGLLFLSTPFDEESVDFLMSLGVPALKMGSGELTNLPLLRHAAGQGVPLILSTGMATIEEVARAVDAIAAEGCPAWALLHCVSAYPANAGSVNLRAMDTLRERFGVPVGFSDHTRGIEVAIAAAARGANLIEKHLTLKRSDVGPDHAVSLEPMELKAMVFAIRNVERALGDGCKKPAEEEEDVARVARRSLFAAVDLAAGSVLQAEMTVARRPGTGLAPDRLDELVGRQLQRDVSAGEMLHSDMFC